MRVSKAKFIAADLTCLALLTAMQVVLSRFLSFNTLSLKIGFAFLPVAIGAAVLGPVGGAIVGMTGALMYISGGLGVFNLLNFIDGTPGGAGISHMIYAIIASLVSAVLAFVIEFITYRPNDDEEGAR